ncbi:hypothetical protein DH2020_025455 [Rehmannia glutinosa]|uniref:WRKY domain-containing protein n=1 Tax=Rehmannia glutinosa TaxID=99300 RepID=A0ABR0W2B1_REHGL
MEPRNYQLFAPPSTPFETPSSSLNFPSSPALFPELGLIYSTASTSAQIDQAQMFLENHYGVSENHVSTNSKIDKRRICGSRKSSVPRFAFQTRSEEDILDDGYRWRKYGQKSELLSMYASNMQCEKQVQRLSKDSAIVETTYQGIHNHPCEKLMQTLTPLLQQIHFLTNTTNSTNNTTNTSTSTDHQL